MRSVNESTYPKEAAGYLLVVDPLPGNDMIHAGISKWWVFQSAREAPHHSSRIPPLKINSWKIIPWRFGSDHVPF